MKSIPSVSIIIPTYERVGDLGECLDTIISQSVLPKEVIVIDNSSLGTAAACVTEKSKLFNSCSTKLCFKQNPSGNSAADARNYGAQVSCGDIIIFIDDDVLLDHNFVEEILLVFLEKPEAKGVQGIQVNIKPRWISNSLRCLFKDYYLSIDQCRVFPCVTGSYPYMLTKVISSEWLPGFNQAYRREVFNEFKFDKKFRGYSDGEDLDFSYRLFKKHPGSLFVSPEAKLRHKKSMVARMPPRNVIIMQEIHELYLLHKLFNTSFKSKVFYCWNRLGRLLIPIIEGFARFSSAKITQSLYRIQAYVICARHSKKIKKGLFEDLLNDLTKEGTGSV